MQCIDPLQEREDRARGLGWRPCCALALALTLPGCATGALPPPVDSGIALPARLPSQPAETTASGATSLTRWWERLGEPSLDTLVGMLASDNPDLAAARARYAAARQSALAERAGLFPQLSTSLSGNRTTSGPIQPGSSRNIFQAELNASWEIDLFGGQRASTRAAQAQARASAADYGDQRRALIGSLARSYVDERLARARIALTETLLQSQRRTRQIAAWRVQAGLATELDNEQARQLVLGTEAQLPGLAADQRSAANRLAVLSGRTPGAIDELIGTASTIPGPVEVTPLTPVEIVRRRPDLRSAEETLIAALEQVGVARAQLLPQLSLSGSLGGSGAGLSSLADALTSSIGALVSQVLFDGGRNRANLAAQKARAEAALQDYRSALLGALEDVDNAYASLAAARERLQSRRGVETATANAARILRQQYAAGVVDFRSLLDAEQNLLSASDQRAQAEADVTSSAITLVQALGGDDPLAAPTITGRS